MVDQNGGNRNSIKRGIQNLINAVNSRDLNRLLDTLTMTELKIVDVRTEYIKEYMMVLETNVSRASLSQAEVQVMYNHVNIYFSGGDFYIFN